MGSSQGYEDGPELNRYSASTFAALSVLLPNMFDQVAVAIQAPSSTPNARARNVSSILTPILSSSHLARA
jgi:hypothetical protein